MTSSNHFLKQKVLSEFVRMKDYLMYNETARSNENWYFAKLKIYIYIYPYMDFLLLLNCL